jgi:hypothetical protein
MVGLLFKSDGVFQLIGRFSRADQVAAHSIQSQAIRSMKIATRQPETAQTKLAQKVYEDMWKRHDASWKKRGESPEAVGQ